LPLKHILLTICPWKYSFDDFPLKIISWKFALKYNLLTICPWKNSLDDLPWNISFWFFRQKNLDCNLSLFILRLSRLKLTINIIFYIKLGETNFSAHFNLDYIYYRIEFTRHNLIWWLSFLLAYSWFQFHWRLPACLSLYSISQSIICLLIRDSYSILLPMSREFM